MYLQTTHEDYKFSDYEVHRSEGDFEWLQSALEEACPERIIPPMVSHSSLHGKCLKEVHIAHMDLLDFSEWHLIFLISCAKSRSILT